MKVQYLLAILLIGFICKVKSQEMYPDSIYLFRTSDDFFNRKISVKLYNTISVDEYLYKVTYLDPITNKKKKFKITDSTFFALEYFRNRSGVKKIKNGKYNYIMFGGGNKNIYCTIGGWNGIYDQEGFIQSIRYEDWFEIYYTDHINKIYSREIEDLLKIKPALLEKYLVEKSITEKKEWRDNKIYIEIRYLKEYIKGNQ
jgi:hypothetical protein